MGGGDQRDGAEALLLSDGPSGVRGEVWDERDPSLNLPSATALAASWDPQIARRYGNVAAVEARRKGVDIVLGPTINLHRSPLGGRHFDRGPGEGDAPREPHTRVRSGPARRGRQAAAGKGAGFPSAG